MNFGDAILAAKAGKGIARTGWNGANMYAYIVPAGNYRAVTEIAYKEFGDTVPYREYWALKTAQGDVATWAPSGSDTLAEDWFVYNPTPTNGQIVQNEDTATTYRKCGQIVTTVNSPSKVFIDMSELSTRYTIDELAEIASAIRVSNLG